MDSRPISEIVEETLEPLDQWVHLLPSMEEGRKGRIYLPAGTGTTSVQRSVVLASGPEASDLQPGDVVLALPDQGIAMRDGSRLVQRQHVIARLHG